MTIGLVFLSVMMACIVWWLMRQTINVQPWEAQASSTVMHAGGASRPLARTALWVFLGVAGSLFALFLSAYAMRLSYDDWAPLPRPRLLIANTVILVAASLAMQWTVFMARRAESRRMQQGLWASGTLTFAFLAGQLLVWKQLHDAGFYVSSSAATGFFYLLTAVHGVHVLGGLVAWARAALRARRGAEPERIRIAIELCATYWHFLLGVWVVLYVLLVSDDLGLAICTSAAPL
jgi:cytochrome c oxidase subunit III